MNLTLIAAISDNGVIGLDGKIPWHFIKYLKRFKDLTMGGDLIMGRKTYESIGAPLPGRRTIVITSKSLEPHENLYWVRSPELAIELLKAMWLVPTSKGAFVCGGAQVYRYFLPLCNRLEITRVHQKMPTDLRSGWVLFPVEIPEYGGHDWELVHKEPGEGYDFLTYKRREHP